jgi:hyaluronan synthase
MTYESIIAGFFPYFVTGTVIAYTWSGDLWNIIWILCTIQAMGLLKGLFASLLRRDPIMFFMSMYGMLYMTSLLPGKYFAMITINKKSWGTSGRKTLLKNYNSLIPLVVWAFILLPGFVYTVVMEVLKSKDDGMPRDKMIYLSIALGSYILYWIIILCCWKCCVQKTLNRKADLTRTENEYGERSQASKSWATAFHSPTEDPSGTWKV